MLGQQHAAHTAQSKMKADRGRTEQMGGSKILCRICSTQNETQVNLTGGEFLRNLAPAWSHDYGAYLYERHARSNNTLGFFLSLGGRSEW
jgi:hypothetical protein